MKNLKRHVATFLIAAAGMMAGNLLANRIDRWGTPAYADENSDVITAKAVELVDASGRRRILIGTSQEGSPGIWFFDQNGKSRLNLGVYEDGNPTVVLNDDQERAVEIFRTVGGTSAPVLVMKSGGTDRLIMGLTEGSADPYLVTYDGKGGTSAVFGHR